MGPSHKRLVVRLAWLIDVESDPARGLTAFGSPERLCDTPPTGTSWVLGKQTSFGRSGSVFWRIAR